MIGKLYIVATPIGNLADITFRAVEVLNSVDLIACEDTRTSKKLLDRFQIQTKTISYHQHSQSGKVDFLLRRLKAGDNIAVITDAGTPGISDPGNKLVAEALVALPDLLVIPIPGPSALVAALSVSGLPTDKFEFLGFMPHKKGKETMIKKIIESNVTIIFYESSHRIMKTMLKIVQMMSVSATSYGEIMPSGAKEKKVVVARELTKKFETIYRGTIQEVIQKLEQDKTKGEFVVIIS